MKLWATDDSRARSKFWYFLAKLRKVKKANGQIVACNDSMERSTGPGDALPAGLSKQLQ